MLLALVFILMVCVLGGAIGGLVSWWLMERTSDARASLHRPVAGFDADLDGQIGEAASQWASAHGQPAAAPLLARKLRLAYGLNERRRTRRRWSR
jgi:hypothetical protein